MADKPIVSDNLTGYIFTWAEYGIAIHAGRIHVHKTDGHVSGEIFVEAHNNNGNLATIYPPTSYNFSSDRTRKDLAKSLLVKNPKLPWGEMFDQLCYGVQERARKGDPVIELCTSAEVKPPEYIIEPLIVKNYPNVIFGDPGAWKSGLSVVLCQIALLPWRDNPMKLEAPTRGVSVLYLDWETDSETIQWQTIQLKKGMGVDVELMLPYRRCAMPLYHDLDQIRLHVNDTKADLVIVDSLGPASGGELKDTQPALEFFAGLRTLHVTSLILAHNAKDRETKTRSIYGNQFYTAQARNVWEMRKEQEAGSNEMTVALFHKKPPPFSGLRNPLGFHLVFNGDAMTIKPSDPKSVGEFRQQMGIKTQIIETLKDGKASTQELAEMLEKTETVIKVRCGELRKKGVLTKIGDEWALLRRDD